jgi:hypothetical protein
MIMTSVSPGQGHHNPSAPLTGPACWTLTRTVVTDALIGILKLRGILLV